jgi:hypothetical protein
MLDAVRLRTGEVDWGSVGARCSLIGGHGRERQHNTMSEARRRARTAGWLRENGSVADAAEERSFSTSSVRELPSLPLWSNEAAAPLSGSSGMEHM